MNELLGETTGQRYKVSTRECASMRLLARDGYTAGVLKMTMHLSRTDNVRYHVVGNCAHEHSVPAIKEWDGKSAPAGLQPSDR